MKQIVKNVFIVIIVLIAPQVVFAQQANQLTQNIRGIVTDNSTGAPISSAIVILNNSNTGTTTNDSGIFSLVNVPIGRHSVTVSCMGYETEIIKEVLVGSAKEAYLEVALVEKPMEMEEVVVRPKINKSESLNSMATIGARMLSVEEASRFAGGLDDPARLVSAYAGVSPGVSNNGISIHGNAPSLLQWRLEDVEIPNPNHFADLNGLGGGLLSSLSSNVLGNSSFFTGAFPAEYSNAVSGVFDMKMRSGSSQRYQQTFQVGVLGIDFASEGPLSRKHSSSYIFNYRYSTTGLLKKIDKGMEGKLAYQDLNFKFNIPTKKAGVFSVWATGLIDEAEPSLDDVAEWDYKEDGIASNAKRKSGAGGISHKYFFKGYKTSLQSTLAVTYADSKANEIVHDEAGIETPRLNISGKTTNLVFTSSLNHKFSTRHSNKTGITVTNIHYDMNLDYTPIFGQPLGNVTNADGNTKLISAYTSSSIKISNDLTLNLGVNGQILTLNSSKTIEPRMGLKWQASSKSSFALGYGLHSRMEKPDVYFVSSGNTLPNKELGFTKSHHFMLGYTYQLSEDMCFKIEPYYQQLYNVPVSADGSYSILNRDDFYITEILVNKGKGRNYGVDFTFEKYLTKGLYYMVTASLFDSKYKAGDGNWYNTRYNRNFIVNGLIGKEWMFGRNMLSVSLRASVLGGQRYAPVDEVLSLAHPDKKIQHDEAKMYSKQFSPMFVGHYTVSYKMNRKRVAHEFAIKSMNATKQKEYIEHRYNIKTGIIEPYKDANSLFNISYRLEF